MKKITILLISLLQFFLVFSQNKELKKDKSTFKLYEPGYYENSILKDVRDINEKKKIHYPQKYFQTDYSNQVFPTDTNKYTIFWHNSPVSQGNAGTCWCFSATSFFESEVYRLTGQKIKLSEMYTVYWEYVERARAFVKTRGNIEYDQGSEANAIPVIWKKYGIVGYNDYHGKLKIQKFHSHAILIKEIKAYLESVKENNEWNEQFVVSTVKSILNKYMGQPPIYVVVNNKKISPQDYLAKVLKLRMNDYFSFMSTKEFPYNEKHELVEADNWRHSDDYYNVPLKDFINIIENSVKMGYTVSICGDVSEAGYNRYAEVSKIPTFDIPSEYINEDARQFRLSNQTTTDDHCIHIVGYQKVNNDYWFLIKDSGSGGFDGTNKGYRFYHQDYIKLKMMNILVHKNVAKNILDSIIK